MLLKAKRRKVYTGAKDLGLGQNTDPANAVQLHLHVWVSKRIPQIRQVRPPRRVLGITFHDHSVFLECVGKRKSCLGFLPRIQIVRLFPTKPVRQRPPNVLSCERRTQMAIKLTRNDDILVVPHQVLQYGRGRCFDIDVSPVHPTVRRPQRRTQQPVPRLRH
jgi:hypothetical protein